MAELAHIVEKLKARFPNGIENVREFRGECTVQVRPDALVELGTFLRDDPDCDFNFLADVSGVDYYPQEPRFGVNYHLLSMQHKLRLRLKVRLNGPNPRAPSATSVWPSANWFERETFDLFGVTFIGHPDLRRLLLPLDFRGHPLRRDNAMAQEEVQFTHNFDQVDKTKPYAKS
jgi:NADH-quinone oxidoreductase subunit C